MRWFAARRNGPSVSARRSGVFLKRALFALACLAGVGFSAGDRFEARAADDGGMMSFLLSGNSGGRARVAAPILRFEAPTIRNRAPTAHRVATARHKARGAHSTRLALTQKRPKQTENLLVSGDSKGLIHKASLETVPLPPARPVAETLALKAATAAARPEDTHLRDKTLRAGDIVATAAGLKVFLGSEQFPYRAKDFAPVSTARNVAQRDVLVALDRSLRGIRAVAALTRPDKAKSAVASRAPVRTAERAKTPAPQTVALAYAPKAEIPASIARAGGSAERALERVVRRVDAPAARPAVAGAPVASVEARAPSKRLE